MNPIIAPIDANASREAIENLQDALLRLHEWRPLGGLSGEILAQLRAEHEAATFEDATRTTLQIYQARHHLERVGFVDPPTADALNQALRDAGLLNGGEEQAGWFLVSGHVVDSSSSPLPLIRVSVFDRDLGDARDHLGTDTTNASGRFTVRYRREAYAQGEVDSADLVFEVVRLMPDGAGAPQPIMAIQRVRAKGEDRAPRPEWIRDDELLLGIPARPVEEVIIVLDARTLPRARSEFEVLQTALQPLLDRLPNRSAAELNEEEYRDVTFAAREIGAQRELVSLFANSHRLARGNFANIPPAAFYGIGRSSRTLSIEAISRRKASELVADLERASADPPNWIPAFESPEVLRRVAHSIVDIATGEVLSRPAVANEPSLTRVFAALQLSAAEQRVALDTQARYRESPTEFWSALSTQEGFRDPVRIGKLQLAVQLELLSGGCDGFVAAAQGMQDVRTLRELAIAPDTLRNLAQQVPEDQLADLAGATVAEKRLALASRIESTLQAAFPTETVALSLRNGPAPEARRATRDAAATFLLTASEPGGVPSGEAFDIRTTNVKQFVARHGERLLQGVAEAERPAIVAEVKRAQRLFGLSASPATFEALSGTAFASAQDIARLPKSTFIATNQAILGGSDVAALVHMRATNVAMDATALVMNALQARSDVQPAVLGPTLKTPPTWAAMFGGAESCECLHCQSIYGKAAHFVNLLEFLRHPPEKTAAGYTPLDHLIGNIDGPVGPHAPRGRRPDLAHIALDCENSDTPLPYVDIVNEVLESYVADGELSQSTAHNVDGRTSAELLANPQYLNEKAYDTLKGALYPVILPFDRPLEATRRYLERIGTSRREVMGTLAGDGEQRWNPAAVAEALGVSAREYEIICGKRFDGSDAGIDVKALYGFQDTNPPSTLGEQMRPVRLFLDRTGLSYLELVELLKTSIVNTSIHSFLEVEALGLTGAELDALESSDFASVPASVTEKLDAAGRTVQMLKGWLTAMKELVVLQAEGDECDLDRTVLQRRDGKALGDDVLLVLHRTVRLARCASLAFDHLDSLLVATGFKTDPVEALLGIAQMRELAGSLKLPLQEALLLWSNLDTLGERSTYGRLFENRALQRSSQAAFRLNRARTELETAAQGMPAKLLDHAPMIAAALRIRDQEFVTIAADAKLGPDAALNLANLSKLYRYPLLARALNMPLSLVIEMRRLLGPDADPLVSPAAALAFIERSNRLQEGELKPAELAYWCRHHDVGDSIGSVVEGQAKTLNTLIHQLLTKSSQEDAALLANPDAAQFRAKLALILGVKDADRFASVVEGTSDLWEDGREDDRESFIRAEKRLDPLLSAQDRVEILNAPLPNGPEDCETQLIERRRAVLVPLMPLAQRQAVAQLVAGVLGLTDPGLAACLLEDTEILHAVTHAGQPMLSQFTTAEADLTAERRKAYIRLYKSFALVSRFGLSAQELKAMADHAAELGGFDLNLLPVVPGGGNAAFGVVSIVTEWAALRVRLPAGPERLVEVLTATTDTERDTRLAVALGTDPVAIAAARAALGMSSAEYQRIKGIRRLVMAWELSTRTGVSLDKLAKWGSEATAPTAEEVANALRARLDDDTWLAAAKEISDRMRLLQRDALVAYLLTMPAIRKLRITTPDQLYQYFLIDVQMDCCMLTSRLTQAISTVQLYVQRCLLDLDPDIRPSMIDAKLYETYKNTRVLEAAKRIFTDTENYCEAELRDNKSPTFRKIESGLLQANLSDEVAAEACATYVAELVKMERLETCGVYFQEAANPAENVLHVISRTRNSAPREYFYRRWVGNSKWTPWDRVDLDIDAREDASGAGVQVLPYVWRDRLYLFWTMMSTKQDEAKSQTIKVGGTTPEKPPAYWEIKLAWSTYEQGRWSPKKLSNAVWEYPSGRHESPIFLAASATQAIGQHELVLGGKSSGHTTSSIGTAADFRLHALDTAGGLRVLVINRWEESTGVFELEHPQDEFWSNDDFWHAESQVSVRGAHRSFMQQNRSGPLSLSIPHGTDQLPQDLLGNAGRFRATLSAQTANVSRAMAHPFFVENTGATYFVETRPTVDMVARKVSVGVAAPPAFDYLKTKDKVFSIAVETGLAAKATTNAKSEIAKATPLAMTSATAVGPWTAAATVVMPSMAKQVELQSGGSHSVAHSLGSVALKDPFLQFGAGETQWVTSPVPAVEARFHAAFHPYASEFMSRLKSGGIAKLLSLDTQSLGNPYLRAPWNAGQRVSGAVNGAASLIESTEGRNPLTGRPGNFEGAVREGNDLVHMWHDNSNVLLPWNKALTISAGVQSAPCLIERASDRQTNPQGVVTQRGTFDVVVKRAGGLEHFSWPASMPPQWTASGVAVANATDAGALIESDYLTAGKRSLDLLVPETTADAGRTQLSHYRRDNADGAWKLQGVVAERTVGPAALAQSSVKTNGHGRLEALVLEPSPTAVDCHWLVHYWKDDTETHWIRGSIVSDAAVGPASLMQSTIQDVRDHGNLEALVHEEGQAVHYWRDSSATVPVWHRGQIVSSSATGPGCLIQGHFGAIGNFEALVPEGTNLQHYWHANEGPTDSPSERFYFLHRHAPTARVTGALPRHEVDFSYGSPYGLYNTELFIDLPDLMSSRFLRMKRYPECLKWLRYVCDFAIDSKEHGPQRVWRALPLRDDDRMSLHKMFLSLHSQRPEDKGVADHMRNVIREWKENPFMPHAIARMRPSVYKKHFVMKYLDCLLDWSRDLHAQAYAIGSIERLNEAIQICVMAAEVLGPRPEIVPRRTKPVRRTYDELRRAGLDEFGNAIVELENELPFASDSYPMEYSGDVAVLVGMVRTLYFCIPRNEKLLGYWDRVGDQLYKMRHCMDPEGVVRQLPLTEPQIDPMMLVKAAANGISLATALGALGAPLPPYRFTFSLQKALELCNEVKSLGAYCLSLIEKKDAEGLARMRASQETKMQRLMKTVREQQLEAAKVLRRQLLASRDSALARWTHYQTMLGEKNNVPALPEIKSIIQEGKYVLSFKTTPAARYQPSGRFQLVDLQSVTMGLSLSAVAGGAAGAAIAGPVGAVAGAIGGSVELEVSSSFDQGTKILSYEKEELVNAFQSTVIAGAAGALETLGSVLNVIPSFSLDVKPFGVGGSVSFGGQNLGSAAAAAGRALHILSSAYSYSAGKAARQAQFVLRERDWAQLNNVAAADIEAIDNQIVHTQVQIDVCNREIWNIEQQIEELVGNEEFLDTKFTRTERYALLEAQAVSDFSTCYRAALAAANACVRCYEFERGVTASGFLSDTGYWDDNHKGLLSGERLALALRQMEQAYLSQNTREFEITRHVSLLALNPLQFIKLKEKGVARFEIPEALFDLDFPGHYMRRIKSVSVTIPCVTGPYTSVSATLRLVKSRIRVKPDDPDNYNYKGEGDARFITNYAACRAIATSSGQRDSGMFELSFRDERYLPFEGEGVDSEWEVELGHELSLLDVNAVSDFILTISYTSRAGGERLKRGAIEALRKAFSRNESNFPIERLFSLRHEFPTQWHELTRSVPEDQEGTITRTVDLPLVKERLPYMLMGRPAIKAVRASVLAVPKPSGTLGAFKLQLTAGEAAPIDLQLQPAPESYGRSLFTSQAMDDAIQSEATAKPWKLEVTMTAAAMRAWSAGVGDLLVVLSIQA
ncbi:neuraminidase-like domain-containing protein [Lysobacter antibioticus]|nr:neuraminidase-like domain-containing protein [Lysobacter antibioticus]